MPDPLKTLASAFAVLVCFLALPGFASADEFFINTLEDETNGPFACAEISGDCSLRDAIERGNESTTEDDVVNFEAVLGGPIALGSQLPPITDTLLIDGTTAENYEGTPVIEIDASGAAAEQGLRIDAPKTEIRGLAITGAVGPGLFFSSEPEGVSCGNYVGVDVTGAAAANGSGIQISSDAEKVRIGGLACGNLISGNEGNGINAEGFDASISGNLIGTDASGEAPLPNTGNGIRATFFADSTAINAVGGVPNTIAFNGGAGVLVESAEAAVVAIYANSIFDNDDLGIKILLEDGLTPPTIEAVKYTAPVSISGTVTGEPNTTYFIDFYANEACDPSGAGEGQTYLSDWDVTTNASGIGKFTAEEGGEGEGEEGLDPIPAGQKVITATSSTQFSEAGEGTSEFSKCFTGKEVTPPPPPPPPPPAQTLALEPVNGESLAVEPVSGTVFIKLPGKGKQVKLTEGMLIPVGSVVDATKGKVTLTSVNKAGEAQTAVFYGGKFLVAQRDGSGLVTLQLRGALKGCTKAGSSMATASGKKGRRLWGSGKGKFRTEGNYGSATVRGTVWLTEDRCTGTFFKVKKGVVTIRDFSANETFPLGKGKTYFAQP